MRTDGRSGNGVRIISRNSKQERYYARSPSNKSVNRVKINPKHREQEDSYVIYYCYPAGAYSSVGWEIISLQKITSLRFCIFANLIVY